jgi:hypothetical protein
MSQRDQILLHLQRRESITPMRALSLFGCFRLAARIAELRAAGHTIMTSTELRGDKRFARYWLVRSA